MKGTAHNPAKNLGSIPKPKATGTLPGGAGRTAEGSSVGKGVGNHMANNDPLCYANGRGACGLPPNKKANPRPVCYAQGPQPFKK